MKSGKIKQNKDDKKKQLKQLFEAVKTGNRDIFDALFPSQTHVDATFTLRENGIVYNVTLLFWAILHKQKAIAIILLAQHKACPNTINTIKGVISTEFMATVAASSRDNEYDFFISLMLNNKAQSSDVLLCDDNAYYYLGFLCRNLTKVSLNEFKMLEKILPRIINRPIVGIVTPLQMMVSKKAPVEIIGLFLECGARHEGIDFSYLIENDQEKNTLETTIENNYLCLLKKIKTLIKNEVIVPCIYQYVSKSKNLDGCEILISHVYGTSVIFFLLRDYLSSKKKGKNITKDYLNYIKGILIEKKNTINDLNKGFTALHYAIATIEDPELTILLLEQGADPNKGELQTAMHAACQEKKSEILKLLLNYGGDPNLRNKVGESPLFISISKHHVEGVKILLENGVDLTLAIIKSPETPETNKDFCLNIAINRYIFGYLVDN
ncbi:MAG: ankyrin repeat domain-containing protein, partial [Gammaproteobacteria bacterium]